MISRQTSSIALMLRHASAAESPAGLDDAQVDAVEKTAPPRSSRTRVYCATAVRSAGREPMALRGGRRAVIEVEGEDADVVHPAVGDLPVFLARAVPGVGLRVQRLRDVGDAVAEHQRCWQLLPGSALRGRDPAGLADPHRPVPGDSQHRAVAAQRDRARLPGTHAVELGGSGVGVEDRDG